MLFSMTALREIRFFNIILLALVGGCICHGIDDMEFNLSDYVHVKQRNVISIEFFDYIRNLTHDNINGRIDFPNIPDINDLKCMADLAKLSESLTKGELWAISFIDAWGTIPSGILYGNFKDFGNYDQCLHINEEISKNYHIQGKYCAASLPNIKGFSVPLGQRIGTALCLPATCTAERIDMVFKQFLNQILKLQISENSTLVVERDCQTSERPPLSGSAVATIIILSILAAMMVISTLYDYFIVPDGSELHPVVRSFSARANARQLFRIVTTYNPNVVPCLHGIRCMSLIWVVYGHDYVLAAMAPNMNALTIYNWIQAPYSSLIQEAVYAVDTFFYLSGLLVIMLALRELDRSKGRLNVGLMYLHRYLRLTPVLGMGILIYYSLLPHFGDGPLWNKIKFENYNSCKDNWWVTLLYVQNYLNRPICLSHSWYLAVDMQLYIFSPIFLFALWKWGKKAVAGTIVLILLLAACVFSMIMIKHYSLFYRNEITPPVNSQKKLYFGTHTRAAPWLIGVIFGYFLHKMRGKTFKLSQSWVWLGWLVSLGLMFTTMFALQPKMQMNAPKLSSLEEASYVVFTRIGWPLAICWVIFACQYGYGGMANSFLSSPLWQPLSKLSYCVYVFHIFMQDINYGLLRSSSYFSNYQVMLHFWADFGFSLLLATLMYLLIEAPMAGIEMMLMPGRKKKPAPTKIAPASTEVNDKRAEAANAPAPVPAAAAAVNGTAPEEIHNEKELEAAQQSATTPNA